MAVTKIWKITNTLDKSISYIENEEKTKNNELQEEPSLTNLVYYAMNPQKTEKQYYVTGVNCNEKKAVQEMSDVKVEFGKTDGILAFHAVQSFAEGEVTPQVAHEIGVKLAEEMWGDRFQVVVTTHLNTDNLHNHFIINSVSFKDGKKLYQDLSALALLRHKSDELCIDYQISVLKEKPVPSGIDFEKFLLKYNAKNQYYEQIKKDIDNCIGKATNYIEFTKLLNEVGYEAIERANKLSIRRIDRKRNVRIERVFGNDYSIKRIQERIIVEKAQVEIQQKYYQKIFISKRRYKRKTRTSKLQKLYISKGLEYSLRGHSRKVCKQEDIEILQRITQNTTFLLTHNIETLGDLNKYKRECNVKLDETTKDIRNVQYLLKKKCIAKEKKEFLTVKLQELKLNRHYQIEEIRKCEQVTESTSKYIEEQKKKANEIERKEKNIDEYGNRYRI